MTGDVEIHAELLIGRRVRDARGRVVGRIEELAIAIAGGEAVISEFHVGPDALWERLGGAALHLPLLSRLPVRPRRMRIPWQSLDLRDPLHPRLTDDARLEPL